MNVFPTDECIWIWKDDGIYDLVTNTFDSSNGNIYGTYSRLYAHIAVCNQFLADAEGNTTLKSCVCAMRCVRCAP